jgi:formate-dependent nitrite reductase membrane component NrfD
MSPRQRDEPEFKSYYGRPILKEPTWSAADIAGYLFLGGLAGGSSILAAGADLTGRSGLARPAKLTAIGAISASAVALVHDLGRPSRFYNMLRVAKPTSPMSVGSWLLAGYTPLAGLSVASDLLRVLPRVGRGAGVGAAVLGAAVASYTSVLIADTAVPAWHEGRRQLPFVFVGSAAASAGGMGMICAPVSQNAPARRTALLGAAGELMAGELLETAAGLVGETYRSGRAGALLNGAKGATALGAVGALLFGGRNRAAAASGAALLLGSALTRFGIFEAGKASTREPRYVVQPQRERLDSAARLSLTRAP